MGEHTFANGIAGGLLPYMNLVLGITEGIPIDLAHESILHLKAALEQTPGGRQLSQNLELDTFAKTPEGAARIAEHRAANALRKELRERPPEREPLPDVQYALHTDKPSLDPHMDQEVVKLCHAINCLPGLQTVESCSGHGKGPMQIWFEANDFEGLFFLTRCTDRRYCPRHKWDITLSVGDTMRPGFFPTGFCLSSVDTDLIGQADALIENMNFHLNHRNFMKLFGLDIRKFDCVEVQA